jgi:NADH-quinone oxidoreductase subunit L
MRQMSGLKKVLPKTRWLMLIGCLALAGFPLTAGFFSKDEIVAASWERSPMLAIVMLLTAFMTAYYTFRLYFRVFEGPEVVPSGPAEGHGHDAHEEHEEEHDAEGASDAAHEHAHNHEPALMIVPLVILAIGAIGAGYIGHHLAAFLGQSPSFEKSYELVVRTTASGEVDPAMFGSHVKVADNVELARHNLHVLMMVLSIIASLLGIALAYAIHLQNRAAADRLAARFAGYVKVLDHKYWVDEIYQAGVVNPAKRLGDLFFAIDRLVIDGLLWLIGFLPQISGFALKLTTQRGELQGYALTMLLGLVIVLVIVFAAL